MKINSFKELFIVLLSEIYEVENHLVAGLPKMISKAYSQELKEALQNHLEETKVQVKRLDEVFKLLREEPCDVQWTGSFSKVFTDSEAYLNDNPSSPLLDAGMIVLAQRIEHYEIATYGTLKEFADLLDYDEVKSILKDTLKEESAADSILTKLAKGGLFSSGINEEAIRE